MREVIQQLSTLKALEIYGELSHDAVGLLATALKSNTTLTSIDLPRMYLIVFGVHRLTITMLDTDIGDDSVKAIATALESNTTLTSLNLRGNRFDCITWLPDTVVRQSLDWFGWQRSHCGYIAMQHHIDIDQSFGYERVFCWVC
jgi:hypothetical protein